MIGLIGAMNVEVEALEEKLQDRKEKRVGMDLFVYGKLFGQETVLAVCGPGKINAALCAQSMILHFQPKWILNLGVAGAGEEGISIGDMVIATAAVEHDMDTSPIGDPVGYVSKIGLIEIPCDLQLREMLVRAAGSVEGMRVHEGIIATGDQFISKAETRKMIHERFGAKAVEMEGAAVAHACYMHSVPCGVLRSISDHANGESEMDYPTFTRIAAAHSQQVVEHVLKGMST